MVTLVSQILLKDSSKNSLICENAAELVLKLQAPG